jgi:hypothetical protein
MMNLFLKNKIIHPLKNDRGAAALMGIVMGIIIMGTIAFNFLAESRQKQSGAILTYTSTNAFMIAEAGTRFVERCLLNTEATCSTDFPDSQTSTAWSTDITVSDNFSNNFGGGKFDISFPVHASNDDDNILVVSTGTYKGAQRSIQRFIPRFGQCPFIDVSQPATSCSNGSGAGTSTQTNAFITPPLPNPPQQVVCPTDAGGDIDMVPDLDVNDLTACIGCPNAACPNFNAGTHLDGNNFLIPRANNYFCNMNVQNTTVMKTTVTDTSGNTDDAISVAKKFTVQDTATVKLNDDAIAVESSSFTVNTGNDRLLVVAHPFVNGDTVVLTTRDTLPAGLSAETPYAVVNKNANNFKVSTSVGGSAIDITDSGTNTHTVIGVNGFTVNTGNNRIKITGHPYKNDDVINLMTSDTLPAGLSSGTSYFVINKNTNNFRLSLTLGGAAISITDNGTGLHAIKNGEQFTIMTVYGDTLLKNLGEIRVKGIYVLYAGDQLTMKNSSKINGLQGNVANNIALVENDVLIKNTSTFIGAIISDAKITIDDDGEVLGALFSSDIKFKDNAILTYQTSPSGNSPGETALDETSAASVCSLGLPPGWTE